MRIKEKIQRYALKWFLVSVVQVRQKSHNNLLFPKIGPSWSAAEDSAAGRAGYAGKAPHWLRFFSHVFKATLYF